MNPRQKLAIVTGGAGLGIGSGVSKVLAQGGWDVLIVDRNEELASQIIAEVEAIGGAIRFIRADLTENDTPRQVVEAALAWRGGVTALVNNAGIGCVTRADELTDEQFDRTFAINVRASFRLAREVVQHLPKPGGTIVNISSVHGRQSSLGFSAYAATKGAVEAMTRGWAVDFGPLGIRVNCVIPGLVDCPQTRQFTAKYVDDVDAYIARWTNTRQLLPQLVANTDVGELVAFLLGPKSQGITGQSIIIDAGTTLMLTDRD
jgi:NAD(P)-dependent dehydrogenase (short-subunit alcohol dehydrogenase family)